MLSTAAKWCWDQISEVVLNPVKTVVGGIAAAVMAAITVWIGGWSTTVWTWLGDGHGMPGWAWLIAGLGLVALLAIVARGAIRRWRDRKPWYFAFRRMLYRGVEWEWSYDRGGRPAGMTGYCPTCLTRVRDHQCGAYVTVPVMLVNCERCKTFIGPSYSGNMQILVAEVVRDLERRIRTWERDMDRPSAARRYRDMEALATDDPEDPRAPQPEPSEPPAMQDAKAALAALAIGGPRTAGTVTPEEYAERKRRASGVI